MDLTQQAEHSSPDVSAMAGYSVGELPKLEKEATERALAVKKGSLGAKEAVYCLMDQVARGIGP